MGPFSRNDLPFKNFVQSPIGLVPKSGANQNRLIFHLSFDFGMEEADRSINYQMPEHLSSVNYNDLDFAIKTCLHLLNDTSTWAGNDHGSRTIFFAKTNLKSVFRILPVLPIQRCLLLMCAHHPITDKAWFFIEKNLPFEASSSCQLFQSFSNALKHLTEHKLCHKFCYTNYLDDFMVCAANQEVCNNRIVAFLNLCAEIGCPVAQDKTEFANSQIVFLGILLNGETHSLAVPLDKRLKALHLLNRAINSKKVTILFVQQLTGVLNFLT